MNTRTIPPEDDFVFGAKGVSEFLHGLYKPSWVWQLVSARLIPCHKRGHRLVFLKSELRAWLLEKRCKTIDELKTEAEQRLETTNR